MFSPPPPFDAIVFDLDGTLADSAADIRDALAFALVAIGRRADERLDALVDGSPLEEVFAAAAPGGTLDEWHAFATAYRDRYAVGDAARTRLYPGVRETLDILHAAAPSVKLAVATSKRTATARSVLETLGIAERFHAVAGSGAEPIPPKPAPDLLLMVSASLRVSPSRALMVGDTLRDIVAGQRAGMRTAAVTYGVGSPTALIAARPDFVLEEFDDVLVAAGLRH